MLRRTRGARGGVVVLLVLFAVSTAAAAGLVKRATGLEGRVRSIAYDPEGQGTVLVATTEGLYAIPVPPPGPPGVRPHARLLQGVQPGDILVLAPGGKGAAWLQPWRPGAYQVTRLAIQRNQHVLQQPLRIGSMPVPVRDALVAPRGQAILTGLPESLADVPGQDWSWQVWNSDGSPGEALPKMQRRAVVFGPGGEAVGYRVPGGLQVHNLVTGDKRSVNLPGPFRRVALSARGERVVTDNVNNASEFTFSTVSTTYKPLAPSPVAGVAISPDGNYTVVWYEGGTLSVMDAGPPPSVTGTPVSLMGRPGVTVTSLHVDNAGRVTAAGVVGPPVPGQPREAWAIKVKGDRVLRGPETFHLSERAVPRILWVKRKIVVIRELDDVHLVKLERP